jgi:4-amino-4-deoxy-L-arabinose transferase-like glycosyltransferase
MNQSIKDYILLTAATLILTAAIWIPHILGIQFYNLDFSNGFSTIYKNYDGIEYIVIAKTLYNPKTIESLPNTLAPHYYAAHFPGFALAILVFAPLFGFLKSMLFVATLFTVLSLLIFYKFVKDFALTDHPLLLSLVFVLLPARWIGVHSVGSSEPMFIFFVILTTYFLLTFEKTNRFIHIFLSSLALSLALITRPPAVLVAVGTGLFILWRYKFNLLKIAQRYWIFVLIPLTLLGIFYWYHFAYNDFFAYFHSGDNIHLTFPPFQIFNKAQFWVGDIWLEDIVYIYLLEVLAGVMLLKQKRHLLGFLVLVYATASLLIAHRDISRYTLPIAPFCLIAFEKLLVSKEFRIVLGVILLGLYLYTQNFLLANTAPIENLMPFN